MTDNASNNSTRHQFLCEEFNFSPSERHVRCAGQVLNLLAKAIFFGSDVDILKFELQDLSFGEQGLSKWRRKGHDREIAQRCQIQASAYDTSAVF